ncbi:hypothetical protein TWF281_009244 [Arthrobotrys megalospora]
MTQFTSIAEAKPRDGSFVNLIGLSVAFKPPNMSAGSDWQATIEICDKSAALYENNLTVRIFRPDSVSLPQELVIGESIVVFKDVKIGVLKKQGNKPVGMTNKARSSWVICKAELPNRRKSSSSQRPDRPRIRIVDNGPYRVEDPEKKKALLTEEDYEACKDLFEFFHTRGGLAGCFGVTERAYNEEIEPKNKMSKKAVLIKEIEYSNFYDLTGFVQHIWSYGQCFEVTITDFTKNENLYSVGKDPFNDDSRSTLHDEVNSYALEGAGVTKKENKSSGEKKWYEKPFGQYSLKIACWDSWKTKAQNEIEEGSYVAFTNVCIDGGKGGKLEGNLREPRNGKKNLRDGFRVLKPNDPALKPLHNRKRELLKLVAQKDSEKAEKERKLKEEKVQAKLAEERKKRMENNPQVHCGYISVETTTIGKILNMLDGSNFDFYNRRYRTECRVVDFRPADIRDFARRIDGDTEACGVDMNASMDTESGHAKPPPEWYWCFELDVMGKEGYKLLTIHVDDSAGRYLLTPEPCDLRADENRFKFDQLRNELFHLWGNLEEIKTKRRDRMEVLEQNAKTLIKQYNEGFDHKFLEQQWCKLEAERLQIQGLPIIVDPAVSNKFFFAIVKEYGEEYEDDDDGEWVMERKFILENTSVSRGLVAREREKATERLARERAAKAQEGVQLPESADVMVIDG